jgi:hypothetical protein
MTDHTDTITTLLLADLQNIEKRGVALSEDLINSLAVIGAAKGCTPQTLIAMVMWDYVRDYNVNMRKDLDEYQRDRERAYKLEKFKSAKKHARRLP